MQTLAESIAACEYRIKVLKRRIAKGKDQAAVKRLDVELARREEMEYA